MAKKLKPTGKNTQGLPINRNRTAAQVGNTEEMKDLAKLQKARYTDKKSFRAEGMKFDEGIRANSANPKMMGARQSMALNKVFTGTSGTTTPPVTKGVPKASPSSAANQSIPRASADTLLDRARDRAAFNRPANKAVTGALSKAGKILGRFAGPVGAAVGIGLTAKDIYDESQTGDIAKYAAGLGGSLAQAFKYNPRDPTQARPATSPVAKRESGYGPSQQVSDSGFQSGQKALSDARAGNQGNDNYPTVRGSSGRSEFETAFRTARDKSGGPEGSFNFKGKEYSTAYKEETSAAGRVIASPSLPIPDFIPKKKKA